MSLSQSDWDAGRAVLDQIGAPVVMFDHVSLAFDEKVILRDLSFTLISGHTKIVLGASGAGKSTILKIITGLLPASGSTASVSTSCPSSR
jgi:ABC-type multidrug transport system ATPase subunit